MATIKISELRPAGSDLFVGSETFMNDLNNLELDVVKGGATPVSIKATIKATKISSAECAGAASAVVSAIRQTFNG